MSTITFDKVTNYFLPKIAIDYNITAESSNKNYPINSTRSNPSWLSFRTGLFSSLLSNNQINIHSDPKEENTPEGKKRKKPSPNYLQLGLLATATAITTAFSLGRLHSSIAEAKDNILCVQHLRRAINNGLILPEAITNITYLYELAEIDRETKLSHYKTSVIGTCLGIAVVITGVFASVELLSIIGIITVVASVTFGTYHAAVHWNDFTRAQNNLNSFQLPELLQQYKIDLKKIPPNAPPPPGWYIPTYN